MRNIIIINAICFIAMFSLFGCAKQSQITDGRINFPYNSSDIGGHDITILVSSRQLGGMGIPVSALPVFRNQSRTYNEIRKDKVGLLYLYKESDNKYGIELTIVNSKKSLYVSGSAYSNNRGKLKMTKAYINGNRAADCVISFIPINRIENSMIRVYNNTCQHYGVDSLLINGLFG